ncbi:hypothetical protein [Halioxenophilus sp. WMMB6]|uniref:hypothetical protein n=1 Tax=Halioxenophilus sp. WMMB6 TaxID=3073815 RepID=UPI00295E71F6|nr:hypothetical protein [Halioxenophilus sp. WMMB6]
MPNHVRLLGQPLLRKGDAAQLMLTTPRAIVATLFAALLFLPSLVWAESIKPFTSDGCSVFPDGTPGQQQLWLACCTEHDYAYWQGGTYEQRMQADLRLHECVTQVGEPEIAELMLAGVRVGGSPYWPTQFRWGYGWSYPRGYRALTDQELAEIADRHREVNISAGEQ